MGRSLLLSTLVHSAFVVALWLLLQENPRLTFESRPASPIWVSPTLQGIPGRGGVPRPVPPPSFKGESRATSRVLDMKEVVSMGNDLPEYPEEALRNRWEGTVRLSVEAGKNSSRVELLESSGHRLLDTAALEAAQQWRVSTQNDNTRYIIPVEFKIEK